MELLKNTNSRIVILNAVPINGGDEALLRATLLGLDQYFEKPSVLVLCNNPQLYQKFFPEIEMDWDWEYAFLKSDSPKSTLWFKIKRRGRKILNRYFKISYFSNISMLLASAREKRIYRELVTADKIIVSAGGYLHDFYGYEKRLNTLNFIHDSLQKPFYILAQSVGPFWKTENFSDLINTFTKAKKVILRESYSLEHLKGIGYHCNNVVVTNDVAFFLHNKYAIKTNEDRRLKKIAVNFREWNYEKESAANLEKAVKLCEKLLGEGYLLTFISTCQGVAGYVDDSLFAEKIVDRLPVEMQEHCFISKEKQSLHTLLATLSAQDAYIGMRLHGAILSLLAGIPAVNIAYEDKTLGIFKLLELEAFSFSYKEDIAVWSDKVDYLVAHYHSYLKEIDRITLEASELAEQNFKYLLE